MIIFRNCKIDFQNYQQYCQFTDILPHLYRQIRIVQLLCELYEPMRRSDYSNKFFQHYILSKLHFFIRTFHCANKSCLALVYIRSICSGLFIMVLESKSVNIYKGRSLAQVCTRNVFTNFRRAFYEL